jgi:hypothetical protein
MKSVVRVASKYMKCSLSCLKSPEADLNVCKGVDSVAYRKISYCTNHKTSLQGSLNTNACERL